MPALTIEFPRGGGSYSWYLDDNLPKLSIDSKTTYTYAIKGSTDERICKA